MIFSDIQNITIPEGDVQRIFDSQYTLWEKKKKESYTGLQYITANGTQYIDTLYSASGDAITINVSASLSSLTNTHSYICWSTNYAMRISREWNRYYAYCKYRASTYGNRSNSTLSIPRNQTTFTLNNAGFIVNGSQMCRPGSGSYGTDDSIKIFDEGMSGNIYSVEILDSTNNTVMYLMPVERDSDGVAGLYDWDNDIFYASAGSSDFIAGPYL